MKIILHRSIVATAMLAVSVAVNCSVIQAQTLKPSYLSDMPAPERILTEIKGKNAEDTIERQMGSFQALMKMIDDMAWGLEKRYLPKRATPDEYHLKETYGVAYADLWHKAANKEDHLYDHDRELLGELLTKFFPQSFRDLYARSDANAEEYYKAYRARMSGPVLTIGPAGQTPAKPVQSIASPPTTSTAPTGAAKHVGTDPSIAKAKAARVDIKVFGLTLGQPINLPTCKDELLSIDEHLCIVDLHAGFAGALFDSLAAEFGIADTSDTTGDVSVQVRLDDAHCPKWVTGCEANAILHDGILVYVAVNTKGRKVENSVNSELKGKYGPPTRIASGKITPDQGNAYDVNDPEWVLAGLRVNYQVVVHNEDIGVDSSKGLVTVMTDTTYQRLVNKPVKQKM